MKKVVLLSLVAMISFAACKKNEIQTPKQNGKNPIAMSGEPPANAVLSIDSFADYQSIIEQSEGTGISNLPSNFVSMKDILNQLDSLKEVGQSAYYSSPYIGDTIYEDYGRLLDVLNQDKIVKLNGNYVKVDLAKDSVYVINDTVNNAYNIIKNNTPCADILSFPTWLNVNLHIWVQINIPPIGGCSDKPAHHGAASHYAYCSTNYRTEDKVVYQTAGIYFSLLAKSKDQQKVVWSWFTWAGGSSKLYMNFTWKVKCGAVQPYWEGYAADWTGSGEFDAGTNKTKFRAYSSTIPLTSYTFGCSFHTPCYTGDYLEIQG